MAGTGHSLQAMWPAFTSRLSNFGTIIHSTSINVHLMLYEGYPFKCNRVHEWEVYGTWLHLQFPQIRNLTAIYNYSRNNLGIQVNIQHFWIPHIWQPECVTSTVTTESHTLRPTHTTYRMLKWSTIDSCLHQHKFDHLKFFINFTVTDHLIYLRVSEHHHLRFF